MGIIALVCLAHIGALQDSFPATPEHRWASEGIALAKREGLFVTYTNEHYRTRGRSPSRYEIAVDFHAIATNHLHAAEASSKTLGDVERATLLRNAALLPYYRRAETEFKREIRSLGIEDDCGQSRIALLTKQTASTSKPRHLLFNDVPVDHWAAKAVGDLRALGLLDGYPDHTFAPPDARKSVRG